MWFFSITREGDFIGFGALGYCGTTLYSGEQTKQDVTV